ncbi:BlaI/MecI/CopY family transcriptional regulator [Bacteroidota bacterium]
MQNLTKAEEQVMQYLWKIKKGFVKDILIHFPEPKPAYSTVSTVFRFLVKKGFVGYKAYGKTHEYYPLVKKNEYRKSQFQYIMSDYFSDSSQKFVSFYTNENDLSLTELKKIKKIVEEQIEKQNSENDE